MGCSSNFGVSGSTKGKVGHRLDGLTEGEVFVLPLIGKVPDQDQGSEQAIALPLPRLNLLL
jgi:hypothetical protein